MSTRVSSGRRPFSCHFLLAAALLIPAACAHAQTPAASAPKEPAATATISSPKTATATVAAAPAAVAAAPAAQPTTQTSAVPGTQNPAAAGGPAPLSPNPADQTAAGPPTDAGLCQCIGNFKDLDIRCPASAESCQSQCGTRYSFVPTAQCTPVVR